MRNVAIGAVGLLLAGFFVQKAASFTARNGDIFTSEFTGEIMDSFCAEDGHHIGVVKGNLNTSRQGCTVTCVKLGGAKFVLYNPNSKRVYKLDDQLQPEPYAGQKVIVTGTYDQETATIRVGKIRPVIAAGL